jgi:hypothetical protein
VLPCLLVGIPHAGRGPPKVRVMMPSRADSPAHQTVRHSRQLAPGNSRHGGLPTIIKPAAAYRQRLERGGSSTPFNAPETWHEPLPESALTTPSRRGTRCRIVIQTAGVTYLHPVTEQDVRERLSVLPQQYLQNLEVVQFSRMSRKRQTFPCYGMQWGNAVYLYPIEESLVELYSRPPKPAQRIEAGMYGAKWQPSAGGQWTLTWTPESLKDFYLNNVLIHEIGHLNDPRNTSYRERERFANWFAIEYGYRASRGRC